MGKGFFEIAPELIIETLKLPSEITLYGADWSFASDCLRLYFHSRHIPERAEGSSPIHTYFVEADEDK